MAREYDDGRADLLDVDIPTRLQPRFVLDKTVADKELFDDPAHFWLVQEEISAPSAFKIQEPLTFRIDLGVKVVILAYLPK